MKYPSEKQLICCQRCIELARLWWAVLPSFIHLKSLQI